MEISKKTHNPFLKKDWTSFEETIENENPLFCSKIKDLEFTFIQKKIVVLMKKDISDEKIREVLFIEQASYKRYLIEIKEVINLLNGFSLRDFIQML